MTHAPLTPRRRHRRRRFGVGGVVAVVSIAIVAIAVVAFAAIAVPAVVTSMRDDSVLFATPTPEPSEPTPTPDVVTPTATPTPTPTATPTEEPPPPPPAPPVSPAAQGCDGGAATTLTVWAHPDDDIIFANPTISDAIAAGQCVRSVFVTAGDAGRGMTYVKSRELGILRAYNNMRGSGEFWNNDDVTLNTGVHISRFTPKDSGRISVLFVRLPDGNITGAGFPATGNATISKLIDGAIPSMAPVDGGPAVTAAQLTASVTELAEAFQPAQTLTHIPRGSAFAPGDHPDHSAVGTIVRGSVGAVPAAAPGIRYYVGYPSIDLPANLGGAQLDAKVDTYRIYAKEDSVIRCADRAACLSTKKFGQWLQRSYPKTEAELQMQ